MINKNIVDEWILRIAYFIIGVSTTTVLILWAFAGTWCLIWLFLIVAVIVIKLHKDSLQVTEEEK